MWPSALLPITNFSIPFVGALKFYHLGLVLFLGVFMVSMFNWVRRDIPLRFSAAGAWFGLLLVYMVLRAQDVVTALYVSGLLVVYVGHLLMPLDGNWRRAVHLMLLLAVASLALYVLLPPGCFVSDYKVVNRADFGNDLCAVRFMSGDIYRLSGFGVDPNHWGLFLVAMLHFTKGSVGRWWTLLLAVGVIATFSRAALIAMAFSFFGRVRLAYLVVLALATSVLAFAFVFFTRGLEVGVQDFGRAFIWLSYIDVIAGRDLSGWLVGSGSSLQVVESVEAFDFQRAPHNSFIYALYQGGVVALLLLVGGMTRLGRRALALIPFLMTLDVLMSPVFWMLIGYLCNVRGPDRQEAQRV